MYIACKFKTLEAKGFGYSTLIQALERSDEDEHNSTSSKFFFPIFPSQIQDLSKKNSSLKTKNPKERTPKTLVLSFLIEFKFEFLLNGKVTLVTNSFTLPSTLTHVCSHMCENLGDFQSNIEKWEWKETSPYPTSQNFIFIKPL